MPKNLRKLLTVAFFIIVIIAAFSLVMSTLNYTEFFSTIEKLSFSIKKFEVRVEGEDLIANATFVLSNRGNYALEVHRVSCQIYMKEADEPFTMVAYPRFELPGPPYTLLQSNSNFTIGPNEIEVKSAKISSDQTITWMINSEVLIETFLGTISPSLPEIVFNSSIS